MGLSSKEVAVGDRLHSSQVGNNELGIEQLGNQQQQLLLLLQCPRCESSNTKFCYYNNYSRLQPRHFCRACRRHWTAGGTLRNVPVGGGIRKNKRPKTAATAASSTIQQAAVGGAEGSTNTDAFDQLMLPLTPMISSDGMTRTFITMDPYEEAGLIDPLPLPASYCWTWWDDGSGSSAPRLE